MTQAPPVTLADFLRARLDEDERMLITGDCYCPDGTVQQRPDCPARIAAEVEAKRRIVELASAPTVMSEISEDVLRLLALPYAGHPSYRSEWAP